MIVLTELVQNKDHPVNDIKVSDWQVQARKWESNEKYQRLTRRIERVERVVTGAYSLGTRSQKGNDRAKSEL